MSVRKLFGAACILLACMLPAAAQNMLTTRTTGVVMQGISLPGILELPVGVPYELEISSEFSAGVQESMWEIYDPAARHAIVLVAGGEEFRFSGTGRLSMTFGEYSDGSQNLFHSLAHDVAWLGEAGGPDVYNFANRINGPAATVPRRSIAQLYETGGFRDPAPPNGSMLVEFTGLTNSEFQRSSFNTHPATFELVLGPIPEPSMLGMMLAGFAAMGAIALFKKTSLSRTVTSVAD